MLELQNLGKEAVMINIVDAAKYLIFLDEEHTVFNKKLVERENRKFYEGNARLNKYLHLAQNIYIAKTGEPLLDTVFYAYDNGAVVPGILDKYSVLLERNWSVPDLPADAEDFLKRIYIAFSGAELDELIELSHEDSEWEAKHGYHKKNDQRMDSMKHKEEYKEQYADMVKVLERMKV